jgi:hypothetical protein
MPRRARALLLGAALALVAVCLALEVAVPAEHGTHWTVVWFHSIPGFNAAVGFVGCVLIVKVSKALGKLWLQRPEEYYGEADDAADPDLPPAEPHDEPHGAHHG